MNIYLAPLEGITTNIFRTAVYNHFSGIDKYFTPFITPTDKAVLSTKILRDILPENNKGQSLVPQILTDSSEGFLNMCKRLEDFGYTEFNINLGCPSGTVVSKGRGAGFLAYPDKLDSFLEKIFKSDYKISIKTRIGKESPEEFFRLLEIYNKYPAAELIIHPRTRADMYKNEPNLEMYSYAVNNTRHRLCYNGNIFTVQDYNSFMDKFPMCENIMIGRGMVTNPALALEIKGEGKLTKEKLKDFYNEIYEEYKIILSGNVPLLHKMKEIMIYITEAFEDNKKIVKKLKKAKNIEEFNRAVTELFELYEIKY